MIRIGDLSLLRFKRAEDYYGEPQHCQDKEHRVRICVRKTFQNC